MLKTSKKLEAAAVHKTNKIKNLNGMKTWVFLCSNYSHIMSQTKIYLKGLFTLQMLFLNQY